MSTVGPESFPKMEHIHGVDISWMTHGNPKDKLGRRASLSKSLSQQALDIPHAASNGTSTSEFAPASAPTTTNGFRTDMFNAPTNTQQTTSTTTLTTTTSTNAKPIPIGGPSPTRPGFTRTGSDEGKTPPIGVSPQRRNSWFSNIASKLSSANGAAQSPPQTNSTSPKNAEFSVPKVNPAKNAVLQHASKPEGDGPYIPAPPGRTQGGVFHIFRRLSSSNGTLGPNGMKGHNHGLVERRILNVDHHRERCEISGLNQAKLRRVAFCVDVEIAPMPRYGDDAAKKTNTKPQVVTTHVAPDGTIMVTNRKEENSKEAEAAAAAKAAAETRKKEKKKKSEEERKARKEKKRKLAEANGTIPMEIHVDSDSSDDGSTTAPAQKQPQQQQQPESSARRTQSMPTTNPVRIYRRCCQLRETPILKKITEQLMDPANLAPEKGVVEKLDLSGYWLQLPDLVTLGDYLAVVPIKEVILDNCGLSDEGLRVILAGLLAARKNSFKRRKQHTGPEGLVPQGGVVERLILKNNKIGAEGWKHICLFVYLCHTLKVLDLSQVPFPQPPPSSPTARTSNDGKKITMDLCQLFSKSLAERLGGSTLTLLSLGETGITTEQLGLIMDGVLKCGIKKIVLANNNLTDQGLAHVKRFLATPTCEGLDLGGNDLREHIDKLAEALDQDNCPLWALSLADCNLTPASLSKLLPTLVKLPQLRYIDLSHNHELFNTEPSAVAVLRKYLPAMPALKRIHLVDCALTPEQVIALAEILPEIPGLAHVSFLENPQIVELTDANTDEAKESACALFASLLSAARVSGSLVAVDIEVPNEQSSDLVKAMAKQVVAYCLRNMGEQMSTVSNFTSMTGGLPDFSSEVEYPDVLQRLVGADVTQPYDPEDNLDIAPDEDYVIGGTGVVKALTCCLDNCDEESRRQSGEFVRDGETGHVHAKPYHPIGKAKETSKHLLLSARKIRTRLQPAIQKARDSHEDTHAYHRLIFLDNTLKGIIKRFEDEFPDTKEIPASTTAADSASFISSGSSFTTYPYDDAEKLLGTSISSIDLAPFASIWGEDAEDPEAAQAAAFGIKPRGLVRSNSSLSLSSRALADEEARVLRAGHKFRSGIVKPEHYMLLNCGVEMIGADPNHARLLHELFDELDDDEYTKMVEERGAVEVFIENKEDVVRKLRELDPAHWDRFVESQEMARKNVEAPVQGNADLSDKCEANMKSLNAAGTGAQGTSELTMRLKTAEKEKERAEESVAPEQK